MNGGPVFIGGLAYSGKTPLRIALGLHPDLSLTRKTQLWDRFAGRFGDLGRPENLDRCLAALLADDGARRLDPDPETLRRAFAEGPATDARLLGLLHAQHAERAGARRWGEQLGSIDRHADAIFAGFPDARMIHMVRDPRDRYAASPHRGPGSARRQTTLWRRSVERAERNRRDHGAGYLVLRYEDLAAAPAATLEAVAAFVDLSCTPEMRQAIEARLAAPAAGERPVSAAARAFVGRSARDEMLRLGYDAPARETA